MEHPDMRMLFDAAWYARRNGLKADDTAWKHFVQHRGTHGLEPNPLFDSRWYRATCPQSARVAPIDHFLRSRPAKAVSPSPLFESDWYLDKYEDVRAAGVDPYKHYIQWGRHEGRLPNHWCDPTYTGASVFDLDLPVNFNADDLLGYISHYTTLTRLISGAEAGAFFSPRIPFWIVAQAVPAGTQPEGGGGVLLGGRREFFNGGCVHSPCQDQTGEGGYRAFQVRYAISPIIRNALTVVGHDLGSKDGMARAYDDIACAVADRSDVQLSQINIVADTMFAPLLRERLADSPFAPLKIVTLDRGYLVRVEFVPKASV